MRLRHAAAILALLLAAGCGERPEDDGRGPIPASPLRALDEEGRPILTPAESAAAVREADEHARRVHEEARRDAGLPEGAAPSPSSPAAVQRYADCLRDVARASSEDERALLEGVCARLPGAP